MLAVVLVPVLVLLAACLMERLEARVAPTASLRIPRRRATTPDATPEPARRHLQAVPALVADADGHDADASWRRAS